MNPVYNSGSPYTQKYGFEIQKADIGRNINTGKHRVVRDGYFISIWGTMKI